MNKITCLCFKGGGVLGVAYCGALKVLWERALIQSIKRIAGCSAGAILATLFTVGYTPGELYTIMSGLNFKSFEDHENIFDLLSPRHGLYRGNYFQTWIEKLISEKTKIAFATFRDFHNLGLPDLSTVTTYLNEGDVVICNYNSTPDVIVSEAVRASMSIPIIFDRFVFTKGFNPTQNFVDGGVMLNYPISLYCGYPDEETIGFYLHDINNRQPPRTLDGLGILQYAKATFEALMNSQNAEFFNNSKYIKQSIIIDNFGIPATDFGISDVDKNRLYNSGVECAEKYLLSLPGFS